MKIKLFIKRSLAILALLPFFSLVSLSAHDNSIIARGGFDRSGGFHDENFNRGSFNREGFNNEDFNRGGDYRRLDENNFYGGYSGYNADPTVVSPDDSTLLYWYDTQQMQQNQQ